MKTSEFILVVLLLIVIIIPAVRQDQQQKDSQMPDIHTVGSSGKIISSGNTYLAGTVATFQLINLVANSSYIVFYGSNSNVSLDTANITLYTYDTEAYIVIDLPTNQNQLDLRLFGYNMTSHTASDILLDELMITITDPGGPLSTSNLVLYFIIPIIIILLLFGSIVKILLLERNKSSFERFFDAMIIQLKTKNKCPACQKITDSDAKYCDDCGTQL